MRRRDKEIVDRSEIDGIIDHCLVCHMACNNGIEPYLVPLSFGYDGSSMYLHTAREGKKIDFLTVNPRVCLQFERTVSLVEHDSDACRFTFTFESVIAYGDATELTDAKAKERGLNMIMLHYSNRKWEFPPTALANTRVWQVPIESITGKRSAREALDSQTEGAD